MTATRRKLTQNESRKLQRLEKKINEVEAKAYQGAPSTIETNNRVLKGLYKKRDDLNAEIDRRIEAQRAKATAAGAEKVLAQVQEEFPPIKSNQEINWDKLLAEAGEQSVSIEIAPLSSQQLEQSLSRIRARLTSLKNDSRFDHARAYLTDQVNNLQSNLREARQEEKALLRIEAEEQTNRDFLAGEAAVKSLRERATAALSKKVLPLHEREAIRKKFTEDAERCLNKYRSIVNSGDPVEGGVHTSAIWKARYEFYKEISDRLKVFEWDLEAPPSLSSLDAKYWNERRFLLPENFNFRPLSERALIVHVAKAWFRAKNDFNALSEIPNYPEPIRIPRKPPVPLETLQKYEMQRCLDALQPVHFDLIDETIYRVETATLEKPNGPALLFWPDGRPVNVQKEVLWDKRANGFRRLPEPTEIVDPKWAVGNQKFECEQDLEGNWVKVPISSAPRENWIQNLEGKWIKDSSLPNGQWQQQPLIRIVNGDHKPPEGDERIEFRYGHWFSKNDCERADSLPLNLNLLPQNSVRTVADQIGIKRDNATPISDEESGNCWRQHEKKIISEMKEKEQANV